MQHTEKYQFKLIDGTDDFSPTPLNDNMEKVEEQFESVETELAALAANLGTKGKTARIAWGTYRGNGKFGEKNPTKITADFIPVVIFLNSEDGHYEPAVYLRGVTQGRGITGGLNQMTWQGTQVSWYNDDHQDSQDNTSGKIYHYIAIGYDGEEL